MSSTRQDRPRFKGSLAKLNTQVTESVLCPYFDNDRDLARLSKSCFTLYAQTEKIRQKRAFLSYLQAIVDENSSMVSRILCSYPNFLFAKPANYGITKAQSHYTKLSYQIGEQTGFSIAQTLQLIEVIKVMLPHYFKKLKVAEKGDNKPTITELKNAWTLQAPTKEEQILLQEEYTNKFIMPIILALSQDVTIRVNASSLGDAKIEHASEETLNAVKRLRDQLFEVKDLKNCVNIVQLLIAAYIAYHSNFERLNWHQRDAYAIGLCQRF